jgi:hypothetical protein
MNKDELELIVDEVFGRVVTHSTRRVAEGNRHSIRIHIMDLMNHNSPDTNYDCLDILRKNIPNVVSVKWGRDFNAISIVMAG